jgi:hypothetical protein
MEDAIHDYVDEDQEALEGCDSEIRFPDPSRCRVCREPLADHAALALDPTDPEHRSPSDLRSWGSWDPRDDDEEAHLPLRVLEVRRVHERSARHDELHEARALSRDFKRRQNDRTQKLRSRPSPRIDLLLS